jgi:hypothetical protein
MTLFFALPVVNIEDVIKESASEHPVVIDHLEVIDLHISLIHIACCFL